MVFELAAIVARHLMRRFGAGLKRFQIGFELCHQPFEVGLALRRGLLAAHLVDPLLGHALGRPRARRDLTREGRIAAGEGAMGDDEIGRRHLEVVVDQEAADGADKIGARLAHPVTGMAGVRGGIRNGCAVASGLAQSQPAKEPPDRLARRCRSCGHAEINGRELTRLSGRGAKFVRRSRRAEQASNFRANFTSRALAPKRSVRWFLSCPSAACVWRPFLPGLPSHRWARWACRLNPRRSTDCSRMPWPAPRPMGRDRLSALQRRRLRRRYATVTTIPGARAPRARPTCRARSRFLRRRRIPRSSGPATCVRRRSGGYIPIPRGHRRSVEADLLPRRAARRVRDRSPPVVGGPETDLP